MNYKILPEEYEKILSLYESGISKTEISNKYNVNRTTIAKIFKKFGITLPRKRKHYFNESYFEKIDTPNKAYFLGLIYADGWVGKGYFGIALQEEDGYIIEEFKKDVEYSGPILFIDKGEGRKFQKRIEICSKKMIRDLFKLGVYRNKSLTLKFPSKEIVPLEFMNHFLRGCFDGDGNIFYKKKLISGITSSEDFCKGLSDFCFKYLNINCFLRRDGRSDAFDIKFSPRQSVIFLNFLYKGGGKRLLRKYKKFVDSLYKLRLTDLNNSHGSKIPADLIKSIVNDPEFCLLD